MRNPSLLLVVAFGIAFAGCADEPPTGPTPVPQEKWACYDDDDYRCLPEDQNPNPDPCPECAGIYLGQYTLTQCTLTELNSDSDADGLTDMCEYELAKGFAPLLSTSPFDQDLSRESYWAAAPGGGADARIIYLLGYHFDNGNMHNCPAQDTHWTYLCDPHLGDSEFIVVYVNYVSGRWRLSSMYTSAHWNTPAGSSSNTSSLDASFPAGLLRHPRVYVALDKHANYPSRASCNSGAFLTDDCEQNQDDERVTVEYMRNVGSETVQRIDRVASITGSPVFPGHEYFWTRGYGFCGWRVADDAPRHSSVCVGSGGEYGYVLRYFGF